MARTWYGVLARLGTPTGDGRTITQDGGGSRDLPLPLLWQRETDEGHDGSQVVGRIGTLRVLDGMVTATGSLFDSAPYEVTEQLEGGVIGPSVDLDDIEYVIDDDGNMVITKWRIAGATLVAIPAFSDVSITLDPMPVESEIGPGGVADSQWSQWSLSASVRSSGWSDMPIADEGSAWDGNAAAGRVFRWAGGPDNPDWSRYARAFLRRDDDANPETRGAYGFGIADVIDGTLTIVPRGVFAAAAAVQGARTGEVPEDAEAMKRVLRGIYRRMDREAPFSLTAAAAGPTRPPTAWFDQPDLDRLTPLTVSDTGRVFGHIAGWGTEHVGLPGGVRPPRSHTGYAAFQVASQLCQDGTELAVGTLVTGPRHADPELSFRAAAQHYDDIDSAVAKVRAGEDEFGIWVAGWMLPTAKPERVEAFISCPVSGDWRLIAGRLELIAVCSVNVPGFPVPRVRASFSARRQRTLIANFGITPTRGELPEPSVKADNSAQRARLAWQLAITESEEI